jgi:hypothetical protein
MPHRSTRALSYPWLQIDPTTNPNEYMQAVLEYCLAGNVGVDSEAGITQVTGNPTNRELAKQSNCSSHAMKEFFGSCVPN